MLTFITPYNIYIIDLVTSIFTIIFEIYYPHNSILQTITNFENHARFYPLIVLSPI